MEILREAGPDGLHVDELARRIDGVLAPGTNGTASTGLVDPDKLGERLGLYRGWAAACKFRARLTCMHMYRSHPEVACDAPLGT